MAIRKILVKHFAFGTWFKIFGTQFRMLRAPRILFPAFAIVGSVIVFDKNYPTLQWYDILLLFILLILVWIGFGFFKWSYFKLYPVKYEELDMEQEYDWLDMKRQGVMKIDGKYNRELTSKEQFRFDVITNIFKDKFKGNFVQLYNLYGLILAIAVIVISFIMFDE